MARKPTADGGRTDDNQQTQTAKDLYGAIDPSEVEEREDWDPALAPEGLVPENAEDGRDYHTAAWDGGVSDLGAADGPYATDDGQPAVLVYVSNQGGVQVHEGTLTRCGQAAVTVVDDDTTRTARWSDMEGRKEAVQNETGRHLGTMLEVRLVESWDDYERRMELLEEARDDDDDDGHALETGEMQDFHAPDPGSLGLVKDADDSDDADEEIRTDGGEAVTHRLTYENRTHGADECGNEYERTTTVEVRGHTVQRNGDVLTFEGVECDDVAGATGTYEVEDGGTVYYVPDDDDRDRYEAGDAAEVSEAGDDEEIRTDGGARTYANSRALLEAVEDGDVSEGDRVEVDYRDNQDREQTDEGALQEVEYVPAGTEHGTGKRTWTTKTTYATLTYDSGHKHPHRLSVEASQVPTVQTTNPRPDDSEGFETSQTLGDGLSVTVWPADDDDDDDQDGDSDDVTNTGPHSRVVVNPEDKTVEVQHEASADVGTTWRTDHTFVGGSFCLNCRAFFDHSVPVNTGHATNGESGCPDCRSADDFRDVVLNEGDERSVTGGYIPTQSRDGAVSLGRALSLAEQADDEEIRTDGGHDVDHLQRSLTGETRYSNEFGKPVTVRQVYAPHDDEAERGIVPIDVELPDGRKETTDVDSLVLDAPDADDLAVGDVYRLPDGVALVVEGVVPADEAPDSARDGPLYQAQLRPKSGQTETHLYGPHNIRQGVSGGAVYAGSAVVTERTPFWCDGCGYPHQAEERRDDRLVDGVTCSYGCAQDVTRENLAARMEEDR